MLAVTNDAQNETAAFIPVNRPLPLLPRPTAGEKANVPDAVGSAARGPRPQVNYRQDEELWRKQAAFLYIFTHFPPETPFLKAAARPQSALPPRLSPWLSPRLSPSLSADTHWGSALTSIRGPQSDNQTFVLFHIFTLLLS